MATSLVMATTSQSGDTATRSITHIDPTVTNAKLKTFAQGINGLTTNTLSDARRVDTTSLIKDAKLDRNMTLTPNTYTWSELSTTIADATTSTLRFSGDDDPIWTVKTEQSETVGGILIETYKVPKFGAGGVLNMVRNGDAISATITASLPETSTYEAASATITITNS